MLRKSLAIVSLALVAASFGASRASAATVHYQARFCEASGDFCEAVAVKDGVRYIAVYATFRRVRLCIRAPSGQNTCHTLRLKSNHDGSYGLSIRWASRFPHREPGVYTVRFSTAALGPFPHPLRFRVKQATHAATRQAPLVLANGEPLGHGALRRRPAQIVYSGDGAAYLGGSGGTRAHLRWTRYTQLGARAVGANWLNNCEPDCVDGTFHAYPASIHLFRPQTIDGYRVFTRMEMRYLHAVPPYPAAHRITAFRLRYDADYNSLYWFN